MEPSRTRLGVERLSAAFAGLRREGGRSDHHRPSDARPACAIPDAWINQAKATLHIAYGHTSHGSQLTDGMTGLAAWKGEPLRLERRRHRRSARPARRRQRLGGDVGYYPDWVNATRAYLGTRSVDRARHQPPERQRHHLVLVRAGCRLHARRRSNQYLTLMSAARGRLPGRHVRLHDRSPRRRGRHRQPEPRATSRSATTAPPTTRSSTTSPTSRATTPTGSSTTCRCSPTTTATTTATATARRAQLGPRLAEHATPRTSTGTTCGAAHSQPLNGNLKAYAAWWLWARLAGWTGNAVRAEHHDQQRDRRRGRRQRGLHGLALGADHGAGHGELRHQQRHRRGWRRLHGGLGLTHVRGGSTSRTISVSDPVGRRLRARRDLQPRPLERGRRHDHRRERARHDPERRPDAPDRGRGLRGDRG